MLSAANSVASAPRDYDLLGGGSDVIDLALLAARSAAAARRAERSSPLDDIDERSLGALADLLDTSATAIEYFGNAAREAVPRVERSPLEWTLLSTWSCTRCAVRPIPRH